MVGRRRSGRRHGWIWPILSLPVLLAAGVGVALWLTLPPAHGTLPLRGLSAPVEVTLDGWGIPRIHAASEADAAAALGYLHARDRLFQMELMRRQASGRLAEIAGPRALRIDRMARIFGERQHAQASYASLSPELKRILVAYTAGVNAWIAQRGRFAAPEFLLLGVPEPWTPTDCLLWSETVSLWLADNFHAELSRAALLRTLPASRVMALWPPTDSTTTPDSSTPGLSQGFLDSLPAFPEPFTLPSQASNAWAVDGRHTATGAPLLAGDPHLAFGFPGLWYLARIETPSGVLAGATAPGVPFLIIGHNARIAWTFTTTGIDTQDVFVETALPGGMYATPDGPRPFETRREVIHVRGAPDTVLTVRATRHGPVIGGPATEDGGKPGDPVLAVAMAQFKLGSPAPGLYALNHAGSVAEAGQAAAAMTAPMQNLTVADHDAIALFTTGKVPVRRAGDGSLPVAGADGQHDWTGFAGGDALPHFVNPSSGTVENANERTAPPDFPVFLGRDFPAPIRARRIHALLSAKPSFSAADFEAMQRDNVSVFAQYMVPALVRSPGAPTQPGLTGRAQALLAGWDFAMGADRPEPLIFNAAVQLFVARVLAANHVDPADAGPWSGFAEWLITPAGNGWCGGDCGAMLRLALHDATENLARRFGPDPTAWRWGSVHRAIFSHPLLGDLPLVGRLASRRVAVDGDDTTLFRGGNGTLQAFESLHGAAYRGIYDLANLDRSLFVVTPGQSGNFLSSNAWNLLPLWARGATIAIPKTPDRVIATLTLQP